MTAQGNTQENSRTGNSVRNLAFSMIGKMADLIARFVLRTVFIRVLTAEYLGLSGLFSNILSFLSLAELGVGTAITFSLYKPIAEGDSHQISILMNIYRKAYIAIGIVVLAAGTALTPFLPYFISEMPDIPNINLIYFLFVLNSAISYFYSYKSAFISANQKNFIVTNNTYLFSVLTSLIQMGILMTTHNYILYLVIQVILTFAANVRISHIADRMYPVLQERTDEKLDDSSRKTILSNIGAMIFQKIGMTVVFSTDNLLLSKMFGLVIEGLYSNYSMIINAVESILYQFFNAIIASVGNLRVTSDQARQIDVFYIVLFMNFWLYSFCAVAFGTMINPFIRIWIGDKYFMDTICVVFIILNFYLKGIRNSCSTFDNSYGLMNRNRYVPIPECVINIVASILIAEWVGPSGIFIGTTVSTVLTSLWREPYVLFKYGLKTSWRKYWMRFALYAGLTLAMYAATELAADWLHAGFIGRLLCVCIIPNLIIIAVFSRTSEFRYLRDLAGRFGKKALRH